MKRIAFILILGLPAIGALGGWWVGPFLARTNATVQLADRIWQEDSLGLEARTLESEEFRAGGRSRDELFEGAAQFERRFALGAGALGLWCGVVIALKLLSSTGTPRQDVYDINHAQCVACGRCFLSCPRERLRLKRMRAAKSGVPLAGHPL